jgi:hypothetical protein
VGVEPLEGGLAVGDQRGQAASDRASCHRQMDLRYPAGTTSSSRALTGNTPTSSCSLLSRSSSGFEALAGELLVIPGRHQERDVVATLGQPVGRLHEGHDIPQVGR